MIEIDPMGVRLGDPAIAEPPPLPVAERHAVGDFTSAAYLGLSHSSAVLGSWEGIALGKPAALAEPPGALETAVALARLQGCQRATLATSTLHLFWDVFDQFDADETIIFVDRGAYAIGRWGVERAAARGVPVHSVGHFDPLSLAHRLAADRTGRRPIVLADGYCPECGRCAPVASYLELVRHRKGLLLLDDTQAVGIFGARTGDGSPYGHGGGGSLRWHNVGAADAGFVWIVASFAKAFGAPVAALSGETTSIVEFEDRSRTRVHCSPPSVPAIRALRHALFVNRTIGDRLRSRLVAVIQRFRDGVLSRGLRVGPGLFPVQSVPVPPGWTPRQCQEALSRRGVSAIVTRGRESARPRISFVFNARHGEREVDHAAGMVAALHAAPALLEVP